jgi:S1-C subfamily serine protease
VHRLHRSVIILVIVGLAIGNGIAYASAVSQAPSVGALEDAVRRVAAQVAPSLVTIRILARRHAEALLPLPDAVPDLAPEGPDIWMMTAGAGFVVDADGWILTCAPLVEEGARVEVVQRDGSTAAVEAIYYDRATEIAALRVARSTLVAQPLDLSSLADPKLGQYVVEVSPGVHAESEPFVSAGPLGALELPLLMDRGPEGPSRVRDVLWAGMAPTPRGAGAPVVSLSGALVGIALPPEIGDHPLGLCIVPAASAIQVFTRLRAGGAVQRAWLGIGLMDAPRGAAGAYVSAVKPGAPADAAGLKPGDQITACTLPDAQQPLQLGSSSELIAALEWRKPGEVVRFDVLRGTEYLAIEVTLGQYPDDPNGARVARPASELLGASCRDATPAECAALGIAGGATLTDLSPGGYAAAMGFREGDVVVAANRTAVSGGDALEALVADVGGGGELTLEIRRVDARGVQAYLASGRL